MRHVNLLRALPKTKRNIQRRAEAKDPAVVAIAKQYGEMYWDGPREYGYGGYRDDGRWHPVARDIIAQFGLETRHAGSRRRMRQGIPGQGAAGGMSGARSLRSRHLAIRADALLAGSRSAAFISAAAEKLPFPDGSFDCVVSLNTIHNFPRPRAVIAMREIQRLSSGCAFVQVDSYLTPEQKEVFESWVLTAEFHDFPEGWLKVFAEAGYTGDYDWTIIE